MREQGSVDELPSGAPSGPGLRRPGPADRQAPHPRRGGPRRPEGVEGCRGRPPPTGDRGAERRHPRTSATVDQCSTATSTSTKAGSAPLAGTASTSTSTSGRSSAAERSATSMPDILDSLHAEMRGCRDHCTDRKQLDHRTAWPHECDGRCRQHRCKPLGNATVRKILRSVQLGVGALDGSATAG